MGIIKLLYTHIKNKSNINKKDKEKCIDNRHEQKFIKIMYKHNENLLNCLMPVIEKKEYKLNVLDVSGTGGDNILSLLQKNIDANYTLLERSQEGLSLAKAKLGEGITYVQGQINDYLKSCGNGTYDVIICTGAFKNIDLKLFMKECQRIIKPEGKLAILIGLKDSMPEIKKLYYKLLIEHREKIKQLILGDNHPTGRKEIDKICYKYNFKKIVSKEAKQVFGFSSPKRLVRWIIQTGILIDYKEMIDLDDIQVKRSLVQLIEEEQVNWVTHRFVYGVWENATIKSNEKKIK